MRISISGVREKTFLPTSNCAFEPLSRAYIHLNCTNTLVTEVPNAMARTRFALILPHDGQHKMHAISYQLWRNGTDSVDAEGSFHTGF